MTEVTFVLHPGYVQSVNDLQVHFIGSQQLGDLYHLERFPKKRVIIFDIRDEQTTRGFRDDPSYIHLYVKSSGTYRLPRNCPRPPT